MKFAIRVPATFLYPAITSPWEAKVTPDDILRFARKVDELKFDWLWVSEHVIMPKEMVPLMGPWFQEALTAASVLLGATKRVRLLTYIVPLPYHHPVVYAKAVATVDFLSSGRITLGVACGHLQREFEILNVPYEERGRITDEYIRAMKELWTNDDPTFHGEYVRFENVAAEPKPLQKPHPPLFIGGDARPVMRRAAKLGDGWIPWLVTRDELPGCLTYIQEQRASQGRTQPFEVLMLLADFPPEDRLNLSRFHIPRERDETVEMIGRLREAGATGAIVHLPVGTSGLDECLEWVEWFSQEIIPVFRK